MQPLIRPAAVNRLAKIIPHTMVVAFELNEVTQHAQCVEASVDITNC